MRLCHAGLLMAVDVMPLHEGMFTFADLTSVFIRYNKPDIDMQLCLIYTS